MFNKSEIMKRAWEIFRNQNRLSSWQRYPFSKCLSQAWSEAKFAINAVKASELNIGDVISFYYGVCPDVEVISAVKGTKPSAWSDKHIVIIAERENGFEDEICVKPSDLVYVVKRANEENPHIAA